MVKITLKLIYPTKIRKTNVTLLNVMDQNLNLSACNDPKINHKNEIM